MSIPAWRIDKYPEQLSENEYALLHSFASLDMLLFGLRIFNVCRDFFFTQITT